MDCLSCNAEMTVLECTEGLDANDLKCKCGAYACMGDNLFWSTPKADPVPLNKEDT